MTDMEKLEEQYQNMEMDDFITSSCETHAYLEMFLDDLSEYRGDIIKELKDANRDVFQGRIRNLFSFITNTYDDIPFYQGEISVLEEEANVTFLFSDLQNSLLRIVTETNYKEVYLLAKMNEIYYHQEIDRLEGDLDLLEYESKGFSCTKERKETVPLSTYEEFIKTHAALLSSSKEVEKVKKI